MTDIVGIIEANVHKIATAIKATFDHPDYEKISPKIEPNKSKSLARGIIHAIFLPAYLTSLNGKSYYRAFGSTGNMCRNSYVYGELCPYVIGMAMYIHFSSNSGIESKEQQHFVHRNIGKDRNYNLEEINPLCSGCGYYHPPEEISDINTVVNGVMDNLRENYTDLYYSVPRRINEFINKNTGKFSGERLIEVFQFGAPKIKTVMKIPFFNDDTIFGPPYDEVENSSGDSSEDSDDEPREKPKNPPPYQEREDVSDFYKVFNKKAVFERLEDVYGSEN